MADLVGVRSKLGRAREHAEQFQREVDALHAERPFSITHGHEDDGWYWFRWRVSDLPDMTRFSLLYGDMLGNLRATLDYLVWQLVLLNDDVEPTRQSFPCISQEKDWKGAAGSDLKGVAPEWVEAIKGLQPFNRDPARNQKPLLAVVNDINNYNKHRLLSPAVSTMERVEIRLDFPEDSPEATATSENFDGVIRDGAPIHRVRFDPSVEFVAVCDVPPTFRVTFDDGYEDVEYSNDELVEWVDSVVDLLAPAFDPM